MYISARAFKRALGCKNQLRYSREWALQSLAALRAQIPLLNIANQVPWRNLYKQPVVIEIHDFDLALKGIQPATDETRVGMASTAREQHFEEIRFAEQRVREDAAPAEEEGSQNKGFGAKLARKALNNLQFAFHGLRLELEDRFGHTYRAGFESLAIQSTDGAFKPVMIEEQKPKAPLYKIIRTEGFNIAMVPTGGAPRSRRAAGQAERSC